MDLKRKMDRPEDNVAGLDAAQACNSVDLDPPMPSPSSSTRKRPMGRDAAKAARKKASTLFAGSSEYASKMHDLSIEKIALFKDTEVERKARLDDIIILEKTKVEDAREHRRTMLELERERLEMEKKRLELKEQERRKEQEKKAKEEDERILAINLDECQPYERIYYEAMQEEIIERLKARRRGSTQ